MKYDGYKGYLYQSRALLLCLHKFWVSALVEGPNEGHPLSRSFRYPLFTHPGNIDDNRYLRRESFFMIDRTNTFTFWKEFSKNLTLDRVNLRVLVMTMLQANRLE